MDTLGVEDDERIRDEIATIIGQIKFFLNVEPYSINIHPQIDEIQAELEALALGPQRLSVRNEEVVRVVLAKHLKLLAEKKPLLYREKLTEERLSEIVEQVIVFLVRKGHIHRDGVPRVVMLSAAPVDEEPIDLELDDRTPGSASGVRWVRAAAISSLGVLVQREIRGVAALIASVVVIFVIVCLGHSIVQPFLNLLRLAAVALAAYGVYQVVTKENRAKAAVAMTLVLGLALFFWSSFAGLGGLFTPTPKTQAANQTPPTDPAKVTGSAPVVAVPDNKVVEGLVEILRKKEDEDRRNDERTQRLENKIEQQQLELYDLQTKLESAPRSPARVASPAPAAQTTAKPARRTTTTAGGSSKIPPGYREVLIGKKMFACPEKGRCIPIRP